MLGVVGREGGKERLCLNCLDTSDFRLCCGHSRISGLASLAPLFMLQSSKTMSLWNRQQTSTIVVASVAGLLAVGATSISLVNSPSPRILKAPEPSEAGEYKHSLFEGGATLQTPYGRLRFYELGPKDGKKVLLIHGISTPCPVWQRLVPQLVNSGHRVLCYVSYKSIFNAFPPSNCLYSLLPGSRRSRLQ